MGWCNKGDFTNQMKLRIPRLSTLENDAQIVKAEKQGFLVSMFDYINLGRLS